MFQDIKTKKKDPNGNFLLQKHSKFISSLLSVMLEMFI